jgi:hypothetical protein
MTYVSVFGGSPVQPADVSYRAIALAADETLEWATDAPNTGSAFARLMDVTPSGAGFSLILPVGGSGSDGADTLIRNLGASDFSVKDSAGVVQATVAGSQSLYFYLSDNSTTAGTWHSVLFGAGSSQLSAAAVASATVVALAGTLNQAFPVTSKAANYAVVAGDRGTAFVWTGGAGTLSLTTAVTLGTNFFFAIRNAGSGALTIDPSGSETIDDAATISLNANDSCHVVCDGTNFYTIGLGRNSTFAYTKLTKSVAGSSNVTLSSTEYSSTVQEFTGLLTGNISVIEPTAVALYYITNSTTGAYTLTVKTAAGTGVAVDQGTRAILYCDGTNVVLAQTGAGAGTVTSVATGTGLTGGPVTTTGTIALANTAVTAGTYPTSGITVDAQGRLTAADDTMANRAATWFF